MDDKKLFKINFIYFVSLTSVALVFFLGHLGFLQNEFLSSFLIQIMIMFSIPLLLHSIMLTKNPKKSLQECGFKKISAKMVGISVLLGIVLYLINSFVASSSQAIIYLLGYESLSSVQTVKASYSLFFKEIVLSCILPGFCEEFLHRGIMLFSNKKYANPRYCLIISSLLFGLTHMNINQFFYATILGLLMGNVAMISNSIYPTMIIHFSNNFISTYLSFGKALNFPVATLINTMLDFLYSNIFLFLIASVSVVVVMLMLYNLLCKSLFKERLVTAMQNVINDLKLSNLPIEEAQEKLNQINSILKKSEIADTVYTKNKQKPNFHACSFLILSFVLGGLITISSFIWGIL